MHRSPRLALLLGALVLASPGTAEAAVRLVRVGTFTAPTFVAAPPGDFHRIFVVERRGTIQVVRDGATLSPPFLDLRPVSTRSRTTRTPSTTAVSFSSARTGCCMPRRVTVAAAGIRRGTGRT